MGFRKLTERTGFEPAVRFDPYTDLANRRYRPLSHLSQINSPFPAAPQMDFAEPAARATERRDLVRSPACEAVACKRSPIVTQLPTFFKPLAQTRPTSLPVAGQPVPVKPNKRQKPPTSDADVDEKNSPRRF